MEKEKMIHALKKYRDQLVAAAVAVAVIAGGLGGYFGMYLPHQAEQEAIALAERQAEEAADKKAQEEADAIAKKEAEEKAQKEEETKAKKAEIQKQANEAYKKQQAEEAVKKEEEAKAKAAEDAKKAEAVTVNKPLENKKDTPASEAKPKPEPPKKEVAAETEDRHPDENAATQTNDPTDESLTHPQLPELYHGKVDDEGMYFHTGIGMFLRKMEFIYGRWGEHPEATMELFDQYMNTDTSPYQLHGDYDWSSGELDTNYRWCSYCGSWVQTDYFGKIGHIDFPRHQAGVKSGFYFPG